MDLVLAERFRMHVLRDLLLQVTLHKKEVFCVKADVTRHGHKQAAVAEPT